MEGEQIYHTTDGREVHDTEGQMTQEEREKNLKKQQELDHTYSLYLSGKGPNPYEKQNKNGDNVVEFPSQKPNLKKAA
jgi:hypothetical protein